MSNFSASVPAALMDQANAALDAAGWGPNNFSVPLATDGTTATHAGLHSWGSVDFRKAVEALALPGLVITEGTGAANFEQHCTARGVTWVQPEGAHDAKAQGERVTVDGKTWESLIDYNVWPPGVSGWREIVAVGYPAWVQPTGAHDAYKLGERVSFEKRNYESAINANVWSPSAYPAGWKAL